MAGYYPSKLPKDHPGGSYLKKELDRVSEAITRIAQGRIFTKASEPPRSPDDGQIAFADGEGWDPGDGKGYYWWDDDAGEWRKLG